MEVHEGLDIADKRRCRPLGRSINDARRSLVTDEAIPKAKNASNLDLVIWHRDLARARDTGEITEEEFQAAQAELLRPKDHWVRRWMDGTSNGQPTF